MPREKGLFSLLLPLVLCLLLLPGAAKADITPIDDTVTWSLRDGTLTIGGTGAMQNYAYSDGRTNAPWFDDRASIRTVIVQNGVTSIGNWAFYRCDALTSVPIPGSSSTSSCSGRGRPRS